MAEPGDILEPTAQLIMDMRHWIGRAITIYALIGVVLVAVRLLKGNGLVEALEFSALWAFISTAAVIGVQVYRSQYGGCARCQDTPQAADQPRSASSSAA